MFLFTCLLSQMVEAPFDVFDENPSMRRSPAVRRVEDMFEQVKSKLPGAPKFLLCVLAERKNSDIYGWLILLSRC
jgi:eukaryotic translation initiation factor 2C